MCEFSTEWTRSWKVFGPDANGRFGSLQGTGGLEAVILDASGTTTGVINDQFGNGVATVSGGTVTWNSTRVGAYGPLPGITPQTLGDVTQLAAVTAWRGHRIDPTGFYWLGARYYDPAAGRFMSVDPLGHAASRSLYDFCNGDPVNYFDPDARCANGKDSTIPTEPWLERTWDDMSSWYHKWYDETFGIDAHLDKVSRFFYLHRQNSYAPNPRTVQMPSTLDDPDSRGSRTFESVTIWEPPIDTLKRSGMYYGINTSGRPTRPDGTPINAPPPSGMNGRNTGNPDPDYPTDRPSAEDLAVTGVLNAGTRLANDFAGATNEGITTLRKFRFAYNPATGEWMMLDISDPNRRPEWIPPGQAAQRLIDTYNGWQRKLPPNIPQPPRPQGGG